MIRICSFFCLCLMLFSSSCGNKQSVAKVMYSNSTQSPSDDIDKKVRKLLSKMTLEDKVGEMTQLSLDVLLKGEPYNVKEPLEFDTAKLKKVLVEYKVGSILNNGGHTRSKEEWRKIIEVIQDYAMHKKESGIPVIYGIDAIHGANYVNLATLYPQQINLAATWNAPLVKELAAISAYETRAADLPWAFAPVLDVGRDPRWSRFWETFGEDVYLVSQMGEASINGLQGDNPAQAVKVAACMKHFLGYSNPRTGKDRTPAYIPERQLREIYLPPFEKAIKMGAKTIMINSGELNGIPVHSNPKILIDLLRKELRFSGVVVTDWEDIAYLHDRHRVAKSYKEAVAMAINAGIDMAMVPHDLAFCRYLIELVQEGTVPIWRIDEAVSRILRLKIELGLFDNVAYSPDRYSDFGSEKFAAKALQGALESIVLLKNNNKLLPLQPNSTILLTGPTANSLSALNGAWTGTWQGRDTLYNTPGKLTVYQALKQWTGGRVSYVEGSSTDTPINIQKAVAQAKQSDVAIVCIGEQPYVELPGNMDDLSLEKAQADLVRAIAKTDTPIVLVFIGGRPRIIREIEPLADAIVFAGLPGNEGGKALTQIISGAYCPDAKLPFTYPRFVNDLVLYDHKGTEIMDKHFGTNGFNPQWSFGSGLSYTSFEYADLSVKKADKSHFVISIKITNTGLRNSNLVVPLFINDKIASVTPSLKKLRKFTKIKLAAGETKTVTFYISKKDLMFVSRENEWITESGVFEVNIEHLTTNFILE